MQDSKETIIFYKEWLTLINSLPDKSRLEFYDLIFSQDKVVLSKIKDAHLRSVLDFVQQKIDKNHVKYEEVITKRKLAGIKSGEARRKKGTKRTSVHSVQQKGTKRTDSVNVNDNDNDNVNVSDKEINKKTKAKKDFFGFDIPAFIQKKTLEDFIENRKTLKKPVTENAMKRLLSSLEKLEAEGQDVNACIDNAILNGYSGVFPINQKSFNQNIAGYKNSYDPAKAKKDLDDVFNNLENKQRGNYAN